MSQTMCFKQSIGLNVNYKHSIKTDCLYL